ncbi:hypothetical protein F2P81_012194 [Scophthalmus maximus]|uniref:Uncharacterized protein n=1 Tax=Scophthalmus maximus TaxID=52904 RepID=A0A6A4SH04_SCOMX|nr:hypothetical protein F2P81_012194 [Scophthalmus maximus]
MEAATAEREREIAALQADLGVVRTELEHWRNTASEYEEEIGRLQEAFALQQQQQNTANQLQGFLSELQLNFHDSPIKPQGAIDGTFPPVCSSSLTREQSQVLSSSLESLEKREEVLQDKLGSLENQHLQDAGRLKSQLDQAQARTHTLQRELSDLRQRYERTEQEKLNIHQELEQLMQKGSARYAHGHSGSSRTL